jgi:hypothetical protein
VIHGKVPMARFSLATMHLARGRRRTHNDTQFRCRAG